jgi:hypothetical protein
VFCVRLWRCVHGVSIPYSYSPSPVVLFHSISRYILTWYRAAPALPPQPLHALPAHALQQRSVSHLAPSFYSRRESRVATAILSRHLGVSLSRLRFVRSRPGERLACGVPAGYTVSSSRNPQSREVDDREGVRTLVVHLDGDGRYARGSARVYGRGWTACIEVESGAQCARRRLFFSLHSMTRLGEAALSRPCERLCAGGVYALLQRERWGERGEEQHSQG